MAQQPQVDPQVMGMGVQPQYVMMPVRQSNGLGVFGLILALVGLVIPTGIIAFLALGVSLVAVGRAPRLAASLGVLVGLLGTIIWMAIDLVAIIAVVVGLAGAAAGTAVAFAITQPETVEMTSDMVNIVLATQHRIEKGEQPTTIAELGLPKPMTLDPWGNPYQLVMSDRAGDFDIVSAGSDEAFGSPDDVALTGFDGFWEQSLASFEGRVEDLAEMLASMQNSQDRFDFAMGEMRFTVANGNVTIHGHDGSGLPLNISVPDRDVSTASTMHTISEGYWNTAAREVDASGMQHDGPTSDAQADDTSHDETTNDHQSSDTQGDH